MERFKQARRPLRACISGYAVERTTKSLIAACPMPEGGSRVGVRKREMDKKK